MKKISLFLFLCILLSSCANTQQFVKNVNENSSENETARIYVLRSSSFGSAVQFKIFQDENLIGKLGPKSYLSWNVVPEGKEINIISKSENKDTLTINPIAGKSYYIKQRVDLGFVVARTRLELIDEEEAKEIMKKLNAPKSEQNK